MGAGPRERSPNGQTTSSDVAERVLSRIDEAELVELTLALAEIPAQPTEEKPVGDFLVAWLTDNGFAPTKLGPPDRFNVLARLRGTGDGHSLLFNSHMDIERVEPQRTIHHAAAIYHSAWRDGDRLYGNAVANDRGPMAAWLIATKAIRDAGVTLRGDVVMTMVVGETEGSSVDEFTGLRFDAQELGARYLASHGGLADFALVAEATNFSIVTAQCGFAYLKVTLSGAPSRYTPLLAEKGAAGELTAISQLARFVERFDDYAAEYESRHTRALANGSRQTAKASIGAVRAGSPYYPCMSPDFARAYVDCRLLPGQDPLGVVRDLEGLLADEGIEGQVEVYKFLPGYESANADALTSTIERAHESIFGDAPSPPPPPATSMWRDMNVFNELGVPAVSYGFRTGYIGDASERSAQDELNTFHVRIPDLVDCSKIYALTALGICSEPRS